MSSETLETLLQEPRIIEASDTFKSQANATPSLYRDAQKDRLKFWETQAENIRWQKRWDTVLTWNRPYAKWFEGGQLNACENCIDIHLDSPKKTKTAILWEGENGDIRTLTYTELSEAVNRLAHALRHQCNVKKGDRITLYMPMIPELAIGVLACARIGAVHSVVFGGFSAHSLRDRILDSESKVILTADGGYRRGKIIPLKEIVNEAISDIPFIEHVIVKSHTQEPVAPGKAPEHDYDTLIKSASETIAPEPMSSEDILFILYTSGTTGNPKGIIHTTGGYLTHAKYSTRMVFDLKDDDIYWCTADIGWITGHTYGIYGPLTNGATILLFEGTPDYPDKNRFWNLIETHKVTIFYTAPTAIRSFMQWGDHYPSSHNLSSLRLLGSVGEPINPEAWMWYYEHIGQKQCPIVDTWWQTETGGIMISTLPALTPMKPGYAGLPLPGISATVLTQEGHPIQTGGGLLSITEPWPSMLRGIWRDPKRYEETYWSKLKTYFAGDGATIDKDGYFMVLGRIDDVLKVSGHRIGTMEVESALVNHPAVAEAAVVGIPDKIKGHAVAAFVILKEGQQATPELRKELTAHVAKEIGTIAKPQLIVFTPELPKTRSGKIMRRLLKNLVEGKPGGDTTTLANPDIMTYLQTTLTPTITPTIK